MLFCPHHEHRSFGFTKPMVSFLLNFVSNMDTAISLLFPPPHSTNNVCWSMVPSLVPFWLSFGSIDKFYHCYRSIDCCKNSFVSIHLAKSAGTATCKPLAILQILSKEILRAPRSTSERYLELIPFVFLHNSICVRIRSNRIFRMAIPSCLLSFMVSPIPINPLWHCLPVFETDVGNGQLFAPGNALCELNLLGRGQGA